MPFIQNKFAFDERPQFGIVVKGSSANKIQLSSENFIGVVSSKVMLANVEQPSYLLEWVKEDMAVLRDTSDVMPIQSGVYVLECLTSPTDPGECGTFSIKPYLTVTDEPLLFVSSGVETEANLHQPPTVGTLRLWENRHYLLKEGRDYRVDYRTGLVTLTYRLRVGSIITADYRYEVDPMGPFEWKWNTADFKTLPGVILAFGKRGRPGDKSAVVVYEDRVDTANAQGGKFEASFDIDVIATDPIQMEEIADFAVMSLWGVKRSLLSYEGLEITDVSIGGESEDTYDENADIYYYMASLSVQLQADWEIHVPLPLTISRVAATNPTLEAQVGADRTAPSVSGIQPLTQGLFFSTTPIIVGRNNAYERIT